MVSVRHLKNRLSREKGSTSVLGFDVQDDESRSNRATMTSSSSNEYITMVSLLCFKNKKIKKNNKKQPQNDGRNQKSTQEEKGLLSPTSTAGMKTL
eukprot:scaffold97_cov66-Skeletonema_marinoi.AAC.1